MWNICKPSGDDSILGALNHQSSSTGDHLDAIISCLQLVVRFCHGQEILHVLLLGLQFWLAVLGEVGNWRSLESNSFSKLGALWWSHKLEGTSVSGGGAHDHSLGLDMSELPWLQVREYANEFILEHLLEGNELLSSGSDISQFSFTKVDLLNVELLRVRANFALDNLSDSEVTVVEPLELWREVRSGLLRWLGLLFLLIFLLVLLGLLLGFILLLFLGWLLLLLRRSRSKLRPDIVEGAVLRLLSEVVLQSVDERIESLHGRLEVIDDRHFL